MRRALSVLLCLLALPSAAAPAAPLPMTPGMAVPGQFFALPPRVGQHFHPLPQRVQISSETPPAPAGEAPTLPSEMTHEQAEQIISLFATPN